MEASDVKARVQELIAANKHLEALELLESSLRGGPSPAQAQDLCDLCNSVGMAFLNKGDMATSLDLLKRAESLAEKQSEFRAAVLNNLACYYRKLGKSRVALTYLDKAREIEAKFPTAKSLANTHLNYCAILSELNKHDEALTHIMKAVILLQDELLTLTLQQQTPGPEKTEVLAVAYHNLAVEVEFQKDVLLTQYSEALSLYKKAADFSVEFLPEGNKVRNDLTKIYADLQPQLSSYVVKAEKKKKQKLKASGSASYLADLRRKASAPIVTTKTPVSQTLNMRTPVHEEDEEEKEQTAEEQPQEASAENAEVPLEP